jgi:hypothetical protein
VISKDISLGEQKKFIIGINAQSLTFHANSEQGGFWAYSTPFNFQVGEWHHIAVTKSGNEFRFYINGSQSGTHTAMVAVVDVPAPLTLGFAEVAPGSQVFFNGDIDEVRIYGRVLSADEVRNIYRGESLPTLLINNEIRPLFGNLKLGASYQLQATTNIAGAWSDLGDPFMATNSSQQHTEAFETSGQDSLFFRLRLVE